MVVNLLRSAQAAVMLAAAAGCSSGGEFLGAFSGTWQGEYVDTSEAIGGTLNFEIREQTEEDSHFCSSGDLSIEIGVVCDEGDDGETAFDVDPSVDCFDPEQGGAFTAGLSGFSSAFVTVYGTVVDGSASGTLEVGSGIGVSDPDASGTWTAE